MYESTQGIETGAAVSGLFAIVLGLFYLVTSIIILASWWKLFTKAGKPGWAILVPFYNAIVMLQVAGKPWWWIILLCIPIVNIVIGILTNFALAVNFGKGAGYVIGLIFLPIVFIPLLAFGDAEYVGSPY